MFEIHSRISFCSFTVVVIFQTYLQHIGINVRIPMNRTQHCMWECMGAGCAPIQGPQNCPIAKRTHQGFGNSIIRFSEIANSLHDLVHVALLMDTHRSTRHYIYTCEYIYIYTHGNPRLACRTHGNMPALPTWPPCRPTKFPRPADPTGSPADLQPLCACACTSASESISASVNTSVSILYPSAHLHVHPRPRAHPNPLSH